MAVQEALQGYELVGRDVHDAEARDAKEQLNERLPLRVGHMASSHELCAAAVWAAGGRADCTTDSDSRGSIIDDKTACRRGRRAVQPGDVWRMVHVYPYENSSDKIFAMHHQD